MTREEAIKIIDCYDIGFYDLSGEKIPADKLADAFDMAIEALSSEAVQGEWMWTEHDDPCYFRCSNCGRMSDEDSDFCPNCGARMYKGGEDEKVKTEMSLPNWIPCSERLPSDGGSYLVTSSLGSVYTAHYHLTDGVGNWQYNRRQYIIAWMPLPKPYEGSESDDV